MSVPDLARLTSPTLEQAVRDRGPLRGADLEGLALAVARTLTGLHGAGRVHGGLSPATVLMTPVGPRVSDPVPSAGRPGPAGDMLAWGRLMAFASSGRDAPADLDAIDRPLRELVEAALRDDPARRPTALRVFATLLEDRATAAPRRSRRARRAGPLLAAGAAAAVVGALLAGRPDTGSLLTMERAHPAADRPPAVRTLFGDTFDDPRSGWPRAGDGRYADGAYLGGATGATETAWVWPLPQPVMPRRVLVSVTVRIRAGSAARAGVFCLGQNLGDGGRPSLYELLVGRGGHPTVTRRFQHTRQPLADGRAEPAGDARHRLQALCAVHDSGTTRLALWVDGVKRFDRTEPTPPAFGGGSGKVGLTVARGSGTAAEVAFDDFSVGTPR